jgi:hypothetical protein
MGTCVVYQIGFTTALIRQCRYLALSLSTTFDTDYVTMCMNDDWILSRLSQGGSNLPGLTERRVQQQGCARSVGWI